MLKILPIVFGIIVIALSTYGLITRDYQFNFVTIFFLSLSMLTLGIYAYQSERKAYAWFLIGVFLFLVYVSIQSFIYS